jgi:hypothetical protein
VELPCFSFWVKGGLSAWFGRVKGLEEKVCLGKKAGLGKAGRTRLNPGNATAVKTTNTPAFNRLQDFQQRILIY